MKTNQVSIKGMEGGNMFEEYSTAFLPENLMHSKANSSAAELLTDDDFIRRRVFPLGLLKATGREAAGLLVLRTFVGRGTAAAKKSLPGSQGRSINRAGSDDMVDSFDGGSNLAFDVDSGICDASRIVIDEVYKVTNNMGLSDSLGMATCLATVGEAVLQSRQPRDAVLRLEKAVIIDRGLLGPYRVHALLSAAKALMKLGELLELPKLPG